MVRQRTKDGDAGGVTARLRRSIDGVVARLGADVLVVWAALVLLWAVTLPGLHARLFVDGVAYLAIAEHLLAGRIDVGLNSYWSPGYAWAQIPLLALVVSPLTATKVVGLGASAVASLALVRLLTLTSWSRGPRLGGALASVPLLVWAASWTTPDLLMAALLLLWLQRVLDPRFVTSRRFALGTGLVAGLSVLAKLVALPVVLTATPVVWLLQRWLGADTRRVVRRDLGRAHVAALAALVVVTGLWAGALSLSEGRVTIGDAPAVNLVVGASGYAGSPILSQGLFAPAHEAAASIWEDPDAMEYATATGHRDPVGDTAEQQQAGGSLADVFAWSTQRWSTAVDNLRRTVGVTSRWRPLAPLVVLGAIGALRRGMPRPDRLVVLASLALGGVVTLGHVLVWVEERYLFGAVLACVPAVIAGLRIGCAAIGRVLGRWRPGRRIGRDRVVGTAVVASLCVLVVGVPGIRAIQATWGDGRLQLEVAQVLRETGAVDAHVASANNWPDTTVACYHAGCRYFGMTSPDLHADWREQLAFHDIDRYVTWDDPDPDPDPELDVDLDLEQLRAATVVGHLGPREIRIHKGH